METERSPKQTQITGESEVVKTFLSQKPENVPNNWELALWFLGLSVKSGISLQDLSKIILGKNKERVVRRLVPGL